jgi:hypothetical protein
LQWLSDNEEDGFYLLSVSDANIGSGAVFTSVTASFVHKILVRGGGRLVISLFLMGGDLGLCLLTVPSHERLLPGDFGT